MENKYVDLTIDFREFITNDAFRFLESLSAIQKPLWGIMTPQHMVEHLIYILENSSDKRQLNLMIPKDKVERSKAFLMSNRSLPVNFKFPLLPQDGLVALKFENLEAAIAGIKNELDYFLSYLDRDGFAEVVHPFYGALNKEELLTFQFKHFTHHLRQFGYPH